MVLAKASINYNHGFIVLANGVTIVNYDRKTFIVQATGLMFRGKVQNLFYRDALHSSSLWSYSQTLD